MKFQSSGVSVFCIFLAVASSQDGSVVSGFVSQPSLRTAQRSPIATDISPRTSSTSPSPTQLSIIASRHRLKDLEWTKPEEHQVTEWLKNYGEVSRFYRRDVFTADDWVRSRRPTRFWDTLRNTFRSGLFRQISLELGVLMACSFGVVLFNRLNWMGLIGRSLPVLKMPLVPFNLAAASLGLLLTFRTNVSYQRWNEARTAWGRVINDSRSLARMACIWSTSYNASPQLIKRFGDAICSFSRSLMNRTLPSQEDDAPFQLYCLKQLNGGYNGDYGTRLLHAKHRPTAALAELSSLLVQFNFHPLHQIEMEKMITELCSSMGACERIFTSPVPTFYPRHTTRFLAVWLYLMPFALFEPLGGGFLLVPVMTLLGGFMLGIEELANQMEEPFSILPMEKMCQNSIRGPVMEQVERSTASVEKTEDSTSDTKPNYTMNASDYYVPKTSDNKPSALMPETLRVNGSTDIAAPKINGARRPDRETLKKFSFEI
ncbi:UPF0187 protein [Seminavis robusta]|uniref:UPF0187 protein n=1 Tax=Seminavis robusta TaxID=568900 RepID=A0A9N8ET48_9STRA|nr:UPF0187 protein [Seminavis robusta]|eukprot:Sro1610_g285770.1 UPF0187 protein (487) ;mRNA; f:1104-2564